MLLGSFGACLLRNLLTGQGAKDKIPVREDMPPGVGTERAEKAQLKQAKEKLD